MLYEASWNTEHRVTFKDKNFSRHFGTHTLNICLALLWTEFVDLIQAVAVFTDIMIISMCM